MPNVIRIIICTMAAIAVLTACNNDDALRATVQMPVSLILPVEAFETRADKPGDPGSWEKFNEPKFLYLYVVLQGNLDGVTGAVGIFHEAQTLNGNWEKTTVNGDSVYKYAGNIQVSIPEGERTKGAVYAAVSHTELSVSSLAEKSYASWESAIGAIKNILFIPTEYNHLQDIYSSPYNLTVATGDEEQYYGTIQEVESAQPHVDNLILFHVAAKVDFLWNVTKEQQAALRLTGMTVKGLSKKGYLFRPNENDVTIATDTYEHPIPIHIGNQWNGRAYFYALPYSDGTNYPLTLDLKANGKTDKSGVALNIPYTNSTETPYTHWMRGDIRINGW